MRYDIRPLDLETEALPIKRQVQVEIKAQEILNVWGILSQDLDPMDQELAAILLFRQIAATPALARLEADLMLNCTDAMFALYLEAYGLKFTHAIKQSVCETLKSPCIKKEDGLFCRLA